MLKCYWAETALIQEPQIFELWMKKVNLQRREKVLRCKNEKDKQRSLLAGILLCHALEEEGISYKDAIFLKSKEGKPFLESQKDVHFSISHAGAYAVCVVSNDIVGIDIECMDKPVFQNENDKRLFSIAKRCLSQTELDKFKQSEEKPKTFLEYWTKKEAYSKALGKGLGMEFSGIDTELEGMRYWTEWLSDGYCISIYTETGIYTDLCIEKIQQSIIG